MSRKDILRTPKPTAAVAAPVERPIKSRSILPLMGSPPAEGATPASSRLTSQVGGAFAEGKARFERAEEIEKRLAEGQTIIELDTDTVDPSFVQDRMPGDIAGLVEAIREQGQQIPILVRPHPEAPGRYQVAFGHRRLRAVSELNLPVKAVVRELTDEQLVIAQGQENNERQDLTFIEKARFASRLTEQFSRDVVMAALSVYKSDLSNMLSVVTRIPTEIVDAIGSAPGIGLKSWVALAELLTRDDDLEQASTFLRSAEAKALPSPDRFKSLVASLKPTPTKRGLPDLLTTPTGLRLAQVTKSKTKLDLSIDRREMPDFAAFVLERLPALFEEHRSRNTTRDQLNNGD
ncbi:plasmid partitioning protein RepB [Rhizobium leguminosarum]|uniref:plasmid partitioning protein RepB n=1 Tax=Rhizobium leguminosarum TaxID=384 RepID=UPI001C98DE7C|nr:plasmid partitioning protein RepB [Rhizobium leguminosarum]MBY5592157.1 plasmid partitioning protein RepB [Rhizobium leguminosarum]MBY5605562.1 plasmid partitioning protein RepB [Rhizobium leguminosarum]